MSYQPFRGGVDLGSGALAGAATYLLGVVLTAVVWHTGLHPDRGVWTSTPDGVADYLTYHAGIHLPGWGGTLRGEVLVYTVVWIYLLVAAGSLVSRRADGGGFKTGASVAVGYLAGTVLAVLHLTSSLSAVPLSELVVPVAIIGVVYPVLFGGIGGLLAEAV